MKFLFIFYIMFWQTTFCFGLSCVPCSGAEECLLKKGFHGKYCDYEEDICITVIDDPLKVVLKRDCANSLKTKIPGTEEHYTIGECKKVETKYYCSCSTHNCNNLKPSKILPVVKLPLMCYQCKVAETPDCLNTTEELLVLCAEKGAGLETDTNLAATTTKVETSTPGDYYCTTEFVNYKTVSRDCKKKEDLPNSDYPDRCYNDGSTKVCACQTEKCNHWSSFSTGSDAEAIKGFFVGVLTSSIICSLVK